MPSSERTRSLIAAPWVLGALIALLMFMLDGRFGSFLGDEGYLWYGVQRVFAGEVPVRDFMSYEIGRYYLSAAVLALFRDHGLLALRASLALWMALGLSLAVALVAKAWNEKRWLWLLMPTLALGIWMVPRHKIFDIVISIVLVAAVARVVAQPCVRRWFGLGIATGIAAVIGQNHGAYALMASAFTFVVLLFSARRDVDWLRDPAAWASGVVVGYLPVICFALFVPGYAAASISALKFLLIEYKGTNLPLPVPWPWLVSLDAFRLQSFVASLFFLALPAGVALGALWIVCRAALGSIRHHPVFVAAILVAIPYTNVAFSRADVSHLAQAVAPVLIAALTLPGVARSMGWQPKILWPAILALLCVAASAQLHPRVQYYKGRTWESVMVGNDRLRMDADAVNFLQAVQRARKAYGLEDGSVLSVPLTPGLSAAFREKNPMWEIYPIFPRSSAFQAAEIARLKARPAALVIVSSVQLDGRPDLAYPATHPEIYRYIVDHYEKVAVPGASPDLEFYITSRDKAFRTESGTR